MGSSGPSNPIVNSTFVYNSASNGAAIDDGAGYNMLVLNSTIVDNIVSNASYGAVNNFTDPGVLTLQNSIVSDTTVVNTSDAAANCHGTITNGGNNIEDGSSCGWVTGQLTSKASKSNTNPWLDPFGNYGGPTQTLRPKPFSLAVDGATYNAPNDCPPTDQRGYKRPADGNKDGVMLCDIGAFELQQVVFLPLIAK